MKNKITLDKMIGYNESKYVNNTSMTTIGKFVDVVCGNPLDMLIRSFDGVNKFPFDKYNFVSEIVDTLNASNNNYAYFIKLDVIDGTNFFEANVIYQTIMFELQCIDCIDGVDGIGKVATGVTKYVPLDNDALHIIRRKYNDLQNDIPTIPFLLDEFNGNN